MQLTLALAFLAGTASAFVPSHSRALPRTVIRSDKSDLGFTPWKPPGDGQTNEYGSTDTPDFFEGDGSANAVADQGMTQTEAKGALQELLTTESWTIGGKEALKDRPSWFSGTPGGIDGTLNFDRSGMTLEVTVENGAMGYEDFYAAVSDDTTGKFRVDPQTGTLERRGGAPQTISIAYQGDGAPGTTGHLIVQTEEEKFTYEIIVS